MKPRTILRPRSRTRVAHRTPFEREVQRERARRIQANRTRPRSRRLCVKPKQIRRELRAFELYPDAFERFGGSLSEATETLDRAGGSIRNVLAAIHRAKFAARRIERARPEALPAGWNGGRP